VRIADGKALLGKQSSLIVIRRTDHSREWAHFSQLRIPLPFKIYRETFLVTNTEIQVVDNLKRKIENLKLLYFVPSPGYQDRKYWIEFMASIAKAGKEF
jgi:hypothetical protein